MGYIDYIFLLVGNICNFLYWKGEKIFFKYFYKRISYILRVLNKKLSEKDLR